MIQQMLNQIDYSLFAELSLVLFAIVFVAVTLRTLLTRGDVTRRQAEIVLHDGPEENQR